MTKQTVGKWRARFIERRIAGLYDDVRPGKPRTIDDERVAHLIRPRCTPSPSTARHNGAYAWWPPRQHAQDQRAAPLPTIWPAAAPRRELQAVQRLVLHREAARCGRPVRSPRWLSAWTRRVNASRWSARNQCCPRGSAMSRSVTHVAKARPTPVEATAQALESQAGSILSRRVSTRSSGTPNSHLIPLQIPPTCVGWRHTSPDLIG